MAAGFQNQADLAEVGLSVTVAGDLASMDVDPARTREVVSNLLANAVRHTPPGGTVEVALERGAGEVVITVRDTGSGMSAEELDRIFDRFYRSPDSPWSGLGLAIARDLVQAHGGVMTATSEVGRGTMVRFTLPVTSPG